MVERHSGAKMNRKIMEARFREIAKEVEAEEEKKQKRLTDFSEEDKKGK